MSCEKSIAANEKNDSEQKTDPSIQRWNKTSYDVEFLIERIGDRDAVVDACLPPQLVQDLRRNNVNAVWVPAMLGDGASDEEIDRQLLRSDWGVWEEKRRNKVLLTRDVEFYKKVRNRAILVSYRRSALSSEEIQRLDLKREVKLLRQHTSATLPPEFKSSIG
jgi:predicted nuclease of predicted toxin-antitoxin system